MRNYARIQHVHLQEAKTHRLVSFCLGMFGSAPPLLSSSEDWDGLLSPVDVVQLPESRPAQTRTLLLPSRTEQGPSENTFLIKSTESKTSIKNTFLSQCTFTYSPKPLNYESKVIKCTLFALQLTNFTRNFA